MAVTFNWVILLLEGLSFGFFTNDWKKDIFKLYNYYHTRADYGEIGVFLTIFIYFGIMLLC